MPISSVWSSTQVKSVASEGWPWPAWSTRLGSSIVFQVMLSQFTGDGSTTLTVFCVLQRLLPEPPSDRVMGSFLSAGLRPRWEGT